jgi:hypothetical protein
LTVGSLKPGSGAAAAAGEVTFDELPAAAKEAGWAIDPVPGKLSVAPGDKKVFTVKFTAPLVPKPGSLALLGLPDRAVLQLGCSLKGGAAAVAGTAAAGSVLPDGSRRVNLVCTAVVQPGASS